MLQIRKNGFYDPNCYRTIKPEFGNREQISVLNKAIKTYEALEKGVEIEIEVERCDYHLKKFEICASFECVCCRKIHIGKYIYASDESNAEQIFLYEKDDESVKCYCGYEFTFTANEYWAYNTLIVKLNN